MIRGRLLNDADQIVAHATHDDDGRDSPQQQYWHSCSSILALDEVTEVVPSCSPSPRPAFPGKSGNFSGFAALIRQVNFEGVMEDNVGGRTAVERAWAVHLATHEEVDPADGLRCSRYLNGRCQAGESDPDELTCHGLAYPNRFRSENWRDQS